MTATGNLTTILTRTQECVVHDLTGAGKADVIYPGTEDGTSSLGRYPGTLGQASVRSPTGKEVVYPPRADALGHETGGQSDSDAPAPDSQTPSKPLRIDGKQ